MYKYNMGGSVPRETNIGGQRHSLAYINPFEEDLLNTQYRGGEGQPMPPVPGPGGVPSYPPYNPGGSSSDPFTDTGARKSDAAGGGPKSTPHRDDDDKKAKMSKSTNAQQKAAEQAAKSMMSVGVSNVGGKTFKDEDRTTTGDPQANIFVSNDVGTRPETYTAESFLGGGDPVYTGATPAAPVAQPTQANSLTESLANFLTPGDMMEYVNGQLVYGPKHPKAGQPVAEGEKNSFGFTAGMADTAPGGGIMGALSGAVSGAVDDVTMGIKAGLFSTREKGIENLLEAGYTQDEIDAYYARTDATKQRMKDQAAANYANRGDDKDMAAAVIDDPCPEGYKLDPITNQCVMDDTIDVLNPGGQQVTDFVMPSVNPVIGQAANYTGAVAPTNMPMPLQPYAPGTSGNLLQSSAPGLARTRAGGIMGL